MRNIAVKMTHHAAWRRAVGWLVFNGAFYTIQVTYRAFKVELYIGAARYWIRCERSLTQIICMSFSRWSIEYEIHQIHRIFAYGCHNQSNVRT